MIEGKRVLITGGAGFIGSMLVGRLVEKNKVVVYDNLSRDSLKNKPYKNHPNLTVVKGDVLDMDGVVAVMKGADIVVHCAAIAGIDTVLHKPVLTLRVNMLGSSNVLEAASRLDRCDRVLCFSTSEVFGVQAFHAAESDGAVVGAVGEPRWAYAVGKLAEEHLAIMYHREQKLPTVVVRPFNVYGPGQVGEGAVRNFILRALEGEPLLIYGDGTQIRAWCHVADMVDGVMLGLVHPKAVGESFNIGNENAVVTTVGLADMCIRIVGSRSVVKFIEHASVDVQVRSLNARKSHALLGFEAKVGLEDGIRSTAEFYRASR